MKLARLWMTTKRRVFLHALERCISGSVRRRWRMDCGNEWSHLFNANVFYPIVSNKKNKITFTVELLLPSYLLHSLQLTVQELGIQLYSKYLTHYPIVVSSLIHPLVHFIPAVIPSPSTYSVPYLIDQPKLVFVVRDCEIVCYLFPFDFFCYVDLSVLVCYQAL